jgi:hypothetical protein
MKVAACCWWMLEVPFEVADQVGETVGEVPSQGVGPLACQASLGEHQKLQEGAASALPCLVDSSAVLALGASPG